MLFENFTSHLSHTHALCMCVTDRLQQVGKGGGLKESKTKSKTKLFFFFMEILNKILSYIYDISKNNNKNKL